MTDYKSKEFEGELKRIVAEDTNMELDDEAMEADSPRQSGTGFVRKDTGIIMD